ncbi:YggT family protein [Aneurinibacillus sp. Ricciae_BoGa-3]|uniref:YggT family protein n=1 Tax=Aneurinibacillus sp. Ricciae_BoGa-3 TaxID=3022697 RepID=UPI0023424D61|nr:YggT family protein [Aneurinibacillus sp. Ricciae_BoGa-3]WCK53063.1 YggT family protein [Aneurinibacillus sp. Ricciae_BoGa-3]
MIQLISLIQVLFEIYSYAIIIYILMSWVPQIRETSIGRLLGRIVEPYLSIFRRIIPPLGMIDISPILAFFALRLAESGLLTIIGYIAGLRA